MGGNRDRIDDIYHRVRDLIDDRYQAHIDDHSGAADRLRDLDDIEIALKRALGDIYTAKRAICASVTARKHAPVVDVSEWRNNMPKWR